MLIREFRIPLPLTTEEYKVAQLYTIIDMSKQETGGQTGVEILANESRECIETGKCREIEKCRETGKCQYTHKIMYIGDHVPSYFRFFCPSDVLKIEEEAWNHYPYCRTVLSSVLFPDTFKLIIETMHLDDMYNDNAHKLDKKELCQREVVYVDISDNLGVEERDYSDDTDPSKFMSEKTRRGPLADGWMHDGKQPKMCCYKLVKVECKFFGIQGKLENFVIRMQKRIFTKFHRMLFCLMDKWFGLTMEDIRILEENAKKDLKNMMGHKSGCKTKYQEHKEF